MPEHVGAMTDARLTELAESAAEKAVVKVLRRLRINLEDDQSMDDFIDNQRFVKDLRVGRGKLGQAASGAAWDVLKKVLGAVLLAGLLAVGASIGVHFPIGTPAAILPPTAGPRP